MDLFVIVVLTALVSSIVSVEVYRATTRALDARTRNNAKQ